MQPLVIFKSICIKYSLAVVASALTTLALFGASQNLTILIGINVLAFISIVSSSLSAVHHADILAHRLGEPYGSLLLSLSVVLLEVSLISAMMTNADPNPDLMRNTLYSMIMIVIGGIAGIALLLGGRRFDTQYVNFGGIKQYLMVIFPLAVLVLVLPSVLPARNFNIGQSSIIASLSLAMYGIFLLIQTKTHQELFIEENVGRIEQSHDAMFSSYKNGWHVVWLIIHLVAVIATAKLNARPLETLFVMCQLPAQCVGFFVASLVLLPEGLGAVRASLKNQAQRAMNLLFGSVLATISLTVPIVTCIALFINQPLVFGLEFQHIVVMLAALTLCHISFSTGQTNALNGSAHLALFIAYLMLILEK